MFKNGVLLASLTLLLFITGVAGAQSDAPDYWPTDGWRTDSPANHGFDEAALQAIPEQVRRDLPFMDGLLIIRDGYLLHESYYNGYDAATLHDLASITKSWTSALVGIAQAQSKLADLDATLPTLLPDYFADDAHADKSDITLRHLLMMRSGIEFDDDWIHTGVYGEELLSGDITAFALSFPMAHAPGTAWNYSTIDSQLISAVFQRATGESLSAFAADHLFEPLGITSFDWLATADGMNIGGGGLSLTPRDMAKLGLLYLHNGWWDGEAVVPAQWVERSISPQGDEAYYVPLDETLVIDFYGYQWWTWKPDWFLGHRSVAAQGYGGQNLNLFPELDLMIVTMAHLEGIDPDTSQEQGGAIYALMTDSIFPALTDVELTVGT